METKIVFGSLNKAYMVHAPTYLKRLNKLVNKAKKQKIKNLYFEEDSVFIYLVGYKNVLRRNWRCYIWCSPSKNSFRAQRKNKKNEWFLYGIDSDKKVRILIKDITSFEGNKVEGVNLMRPLTNRYYDKSLNIYLDIYDNVINMEMC